MAADPSPIIAQLLANTGFGQTANQIAAANLANQQGQQGLQIGQQSIALNNLKLQAAQAQKQQQDAYNADVAAWLAHGSPPSEVASLVAKYPDQWQAFGLAYKSGNEQQKRSDLAFYGSIRSMLDAKKVDIAGLRQQLANRRAAYAKAGQDTSILDYYLQAIDSGDTTALNSLKGLATMSMAATDPDQFSSIFKTTEAKSQPYTLSPGAKRFDGENNVIAEAPFAPRVVTVGPDQTAVEYQPGAKGGDPASAASGSYTGGWTPRSRNGGDNSDAAVDSKIAGAAQFLGVDPNADISGMSPLQIAKAMALSEGGAGSLADRNNNPGNLRDPKTGAYKKFPTKEAGLAAAAAQVKRNLARGQTTVRSMIEGLPTGGAQTGGPRVIAQGAPKQQYRMLTPQEKQAAGLDPNLQYQQSPSGQITPLGGQNKQVKQIPDAVVTKVQPQIDARDTLGSALSTFRPDYGGHWVLGDRANDLQAIAGTGPAGMREWWARVYSMDNTVRNQLFGSALTANEQAAWERTTVSPKMRPEAIQANLRQRKAILDKALARRENFLKKNGYDPDAVDALFAPLGGSPQAAPTPSAPQFRIVARRPAR